MNIIKRFNIPTLISAINLMGKRSKVFVVMIFIFICIEAAGVPLMGYGIKGVVNAVSDADNTLFWRSIILIVINLLLWCFYSPISGYMCAWASKKGIKDIKTYLAEHLLNLPQKYHDSKPKGYILSLITNDLNCLEHIYDSDIFQVVRHAVIGISGLVTMFIIDWRFALIVLTLGTCSVYISMYFSSKFEKVGEMLQNQLSQNSTEFFGIIKAAKTIHLLCLMRPILEDFSKSTQHESDARIKNTELKAKMDSINKLISTLSYIMILIIGAVFVYFKLSDWGIIISLAGLKGIADCLFYECSMHMASMQQNIAGVKRVLVALKESKEIINTTKYSFETNINQSGSVLSLQNVSFSYNGVSNVLKSIDLSFEIGELNVLVGESGSGKSTLLKILLSLYEPTEGVILFEESLPKKITLSTIREKTAYVPQDPILFNGTIYENIACGNQLATYDDVIEAAKSAEADSFILQTTDGYQTILCDDGKSLSGGQRQRIAIARALIKKTPILLFDEITSALDIENETKILETIYKLKEDHCVVITTHKPEVIQCADKIIRLENGSVL